MKLISMLDYDLVLERLHGKDRQSLYGEMLKRLMDNAELELHLDLPKVVNQLIESENNTAIGKGGIAMPHLRINGLEDLYIVIGLPEKPLMLKENDTEPTSLIVLSLIADKMSDVYLKTISALARHLAVPEQRSALLRAACGGRDALWNYFETHDFKMKKIVTAEDVMSPTDTVVELDAPLSSAFDIFNTTHRTQLPVVDASGRLAGEISALNVVKKFIPDYVFMMDNLNFLNNFEVFNQIFDSEHSEPVKHYLNAEPVTAELDTPLIQLTLQLAKQDAEVIYIVDAERRLVGLFDITNLVHKVLRG